MLLRCKTPLFLMEESTLSQINLRVLMVVLIIGTSASPLFGQQKAQWVPGQYGLNAGSIPVPGVTYANIALNYSSDRLNDSNGNRVTQNVNGTYSFWVDENIF